MTSLSERKRIRKLHIRNLKLNKRLDLNGSWKCRFGAEDRATEVRWLPEILYRNQLGNRSPVSEDTKILCAQDIVARYICI